MTFDELYRAILDVLPTASLDEDSEGQIVIYTDLMINPDRESRGSKEIIPFVCEDKDD